MTLPVRSDTMSWSPERGWSHSVQNEDNSLTKDNVLGFIEEMGRVLNEANVPTENRWVRIHMWRGRSKRRPKKRLFKKKNRLVAFARKEASGDRFVLEDRERKTLGFYLEER